MFSLVVILFTRVTFMPWHLMCEAHLKAALVAHDPWIEILRLFVQLSIRTRFPQAPSKIFFGRQKVECAEVLVLLQRFLGRVET